MVLSLLVVVGCATRDAAAVKAALRIHDVQFEQAAIAACQRAVHIFNTTPTLGQQPSQAQAADLLDKIDATFAALVAELRQIPVAPADRDAVNGWLRDWDSYVAFGRTYAGAVRTGSERDLVARDSASQGALRRSLQAFAVANNMKACRFP
jgi:hypothetical protein